MLLPHHFTNTQISSKLLIMKLLSEPVALEDEGIAIHYAQPRALDALEHEHPLAERGWLALAHTTLEGTPDVLLLEKHGKFRLIELFEDYAWVKNKRCLAWDDFVREETERGDRKGWIDSIYEKLNVLVTACQNPMFGWVLTMITARIGCWVSSFENQISS